MDRPRLRPNSPGEVGFGKLEVPFDAFRGVRADDGLTGSNPTSVVSLETEKVPTQRSTSPVTGKVPCAQITFGG